jgi:hypothetical protein
MNPGKGAGFTHSLKIRYAHRRNRGIVWKADMVLNPCGEIIGEDSTTIFQRFTLIRLIK